MEASRNTGSVPFGGAEIAGELARPLGHQDGGALHPAVGDPAVHHLGGLVQLGACPSLPAAACGRQLDVAIMAAPLSSMSLRFIRFPRFILASS